MLELAFGRGFVGFGPFVFSAVKVKVAFRECPRPHSLLLFKAQAGEMELGTNKRL